MKKIFAVTMGLLIALIISITSESEAAMLADWNMDETVGTVVNDISGNGNIGYLNNMTDANHVPGILGNALSFNGVNQWVDFDTSTAINNLTENITVETWVKGLAANNSSDLVLIFDKSHGWADSTGWGIQMRPGGSEIAFFVGLGGAGAGDFLAAANDNINVLDGQWHQVVGTWDKSTIDLYIDGELEGSTSLAAIQFAGNTRPMEMGRSWGGGAPNRYFNGDIDETAIFDEALSADTIENQYQNVIQQENAVPEPSSLLFIGFGGIITAFIKRRRKA